LVSMKMLPAIVAIDFCATVRLPVFWESEVGESQGGFFGGAGLGRFGLLFCLLSKELNEMQDFGLQMRWQVAIFFEKQLFCHG